MDVVALKAMTVIVAMPVIRALAVIVGMLGQSMGMPVPEVRLGVELAHTGPAAVAAPAFGGTES